MRFNSALFKKCAEYKELPIVITCETAADILGLTSTYGALQYCAERDFNIEGLKWLGNNPNITGDSWLKTGGNLKISGNIETIIALITYDISQWGYKALCNALRWNLQEVRWAERVIELGLEDELYTKIKYAVELNEEDEGIIKCADVRFKQARKRQKGHI